MKDFFAELFETPLELIERSDSYVNEKIRPITQKLDEKNTKLKYYLNGIGWFGVSSFFPNYDNIVGFIPLGLFSPINHFTGPCTFITNLFTNNHTGYKFNSNGEKMIEDLLMFKVNNIAKNTRFGTIVEGLCQIGYASYSFLSEKNLSPEAYFCLGNGTNCLVRGFSTYLKQADDEEPRIKNKLFQKTRGKLETKLLISQSS